jgi:ABC-2 type transport system ATP-binding protein
MRQRLGLAQALMERPELLLLDEPTNGLDPAGIVDLRHLIRQLADQGVTIFLASHLLTEVERVCDRVLLVRQGEVVRQIVLAEEKVMVRVIVSNTDDVPLLHQWAQASGLGVEQVGEGAERPTFHFEAARPTPQLVRELVQASINIEEVSLARQTLEEAFMELVGTD